MVPLACPSGRSGHRKWGLAVTFMAAAALGLGTVVGAPEAQARTAAAEPVALSQLPPQAQETYRRVLTGGPFAHGKDGSVFGNRERLLPLKPRGYYREYTVETPGSADRGARRIVCGGTPPTKPDQCYYTADHYASFARILP